MSTYSTNLAIELIDTGAQAGVWGNTTNTNLGTLIEQAISGYVTQAVSTGTTTTITIPNGATGVARNMAIELTGTGGTNTFLEVPSNKKLYFIYNNTTGAVTVRVTGQTGVSVPASAKMILVSNGTDVVVATNYMAQLALGTALPVSSGGTGQTTANAAFNALAPSQLLQSGKYLKTDGVNTSWDAIDVSTADITGTLPVANGGTGVTTSTGTGSVVLSNSPSLTTPNLGTPTAATLTNATGLPLTTGVTGTLPINKGGTGVTATPTDGQILIGNGTGYTLSTITGSTNVTVTNTPGGITISATPGAGGVSSFSAGTTGLTPATATTGGITLGGTLAVANGGTGVTTSTGTGSVVLSTSPTLTTPNLGTPSAATLTNATGLPIVAGTTGTLSVARGGTGVTTSTGTGSVVLSTSPALTTPDLGTPSAATLTNATGLPIVAGTTGTLSVARGGTGQTTYTDGQLLIGNSTGNTLTKATLTAGSGVSITNGNGSITIAATGTGGTVTSVSGTGSVNGITLSGTVTSSGSLTLGGTLSGVSLTTQVSGTLPVGNGGTGVATLTGLAYGNGTSAFTAATAAQIVSAIGSTAVTNATNATNATTAATVSTTVSSGATGTTQANGDNSTKIATTAYVQNMDFGQSQSWTDVTSSRSSGTTYTNSTGKAIMVSINGNMLSGINVTVGGVTVAAYGGINNSFNYAFVVPAGATYSYTGGLNSWVELR